MNDYLSTLVIRTLRPAETLQPRHASMFEPATARSDAAGFDAAGYMAPGPSHAAMPMEEDTGYGSALAIRDEPAAGRYASARENRAAASLPYSSPLEPGNDAPWRLDQVVRPRLREEAANPDIEPSRPSPAVRALRELSGEMEQGVEAGDSAGMIPSAGRAAAPAIHERIDAIRPDHRRSIQATHTMRQDDIRDLSRDGSTSGSDGRDTIIRPDRFSTATGRGVHESISISGASSAYEPAGDSAGESSITPGPERRNRRGGLLEPASPALRDTHPLPLLVPNPEPAREQRSEPPTIRVTIGRIEVRAIMPQAPSRPEPPAPKRGPGLSLDDYLRAQKRGYR